MAVDATHPLVNFPGAFYDSARRLMIWRPRGVLDDAVADQVVDFVSTQERIMDTPFDRFTDFGGLTHIRLQIGHVFDLVQQRRASSVGQPPVKSAIFSSSVVGFGIASLCASLMEGATIEVRPFRTRASAAEWLETPLEALIDFAAEDDDDHDSDDSI